MGVAASPLAYHKDSAHWHRRALLSPRMMSVHVVGAGLSGLAAAVELARAGHRVQVSEMAAQAGGRCRSYRDDLLGLTIDNGNHLVLSGNSSVAHYIDTIGSRAALQRPTSTRFEFVDISLNKRWTLRPSEGRWPWWLLDKRRRVPGTSVTDYFALGTFARSHPGKRIDQVFTCSGALWDRLLRPLLVSILNTAPEEASADLAGAVLRETLFKGGRWTRPLLAIPHLADAYIDPAVAFIRQSGGEVRFGRQLQAIGHDNDRVHHLSFNDGVTELAEDDRVILAVPAWTARTLLPQISAPDEYRAIINAHFRFTPPAGLPPFLGLVGGTAEWIFLFADRVSVTVSAADHLVDADVGDLTALLWRDVATALDLRQAMPPCRIVKERRATFAPTPAQEARRPGPLGSWSNLLLAGDWVATGLPATIEGAVRSGQSAARLAVGMAT